MAPEQAAGRTDQIGPPADIYALGVVLYELLCGKRPFEGSFGEVLKQVQTSEPLAPRQLKPGLHRDLETICLKAMAKEPQWRYESAAALAEDLERFGKGEAILARRESLVSQLSRKVRRNPLVAASAVAVLLAITLTAVLGLQYLAFQRTAVIARDIDARLNQAALEESYLLETEAKIADLQQVAPEQAANARRRLSQQFQAAILAQLNRPVLPAEDVRRVEAAINLLQQRSPQLASSLRQTLAQRKRNWQPIFELTAPYDGIDEVFTPRQMALVDGQLVPARDTTASELAEHVELTSQECSGNVELHAVFAAGWASAAELGLLLNAREQGGYRFVIRPLADPDAGPQDTWSFEQAREGDGQVSVQIQRGETTLIEQHQPAAKLGTAALRLEARHEGNWLTFQVGDSQPLTFRDIFSVSSRDTGKFGLVWPAGVALTSLRGYRQTLPAEASPLEQGDGLYLQGEYSQAREFYRQQAIASAGTNAALEARYKEALCLLSLQRNNDAANQFESIATATSSSNVDNANDWPLLAACRLWLLRLRQDRADDADAVFQSLSTRYRFEQLAVLIPAALRREIITQYQRAGTAINFLNFNPDRVRDLERAVEVERFLQVAEINHVHTKRSLLRAYRLSGNIDAAMQFAEEMVVIESINEMGWDDNLVEEFSWLMRLHGDPRRGLHEIDRRLFESPGVYRDHLLSLLVERARVHAALNQWDEANKDIEDFFRLVPNVKDFSYHYYSAAALMRGFLRERQGDTAGAREAWRQGRAAVDANATNSLLWVTGEGSRMQLLNYMILSSLSGEMTDAEADAVKFLELARQEASPDSLLHRRATASIASLNEQ